MPEKTLKESTSAKATVDEKVERAREVMDSVIGADFPASMDVIEEALTALEEENTRLREINQKAIKTIEQYAVRLGVLKVVEEEAQDNGK